MTYESILFSFNGFPVFEYTEFTSNGVRPAFKYSSTPAHTDVVFGVVLAAGLPVLSADCRYVRIPGHVNTDSGAM